MKLYFKDVVTDELFPVECQPTDTMDQIKRQFLLFQPIPLSTSDLTVEFCLQDKTYVRDKATACSGTLEQNHVEEYDIVLFIYPME